MNEYLNRVPSDVAVSVALITYNHEKYIGQAIESILGQKCNFSFELCIGEDESTDTTRDICIEYAKKYPTIIRLFLRSKENKIKLNGKPTGRRNGIATRRACRGKYIALIEGDDFWIDEYKLQKQYDLMEIKPECGICCTRAIKRFVNTGIDRVYPRYFPQGIPQSMFYQTRTNIATATYFYRRSCERREITENENVFVGDWAYMMSLTENHRCLMLPGITAVYRKHDDGFWTGGELEALDKLQITLNSVEEYLKSCPGIPPKGLYSTRNQYRRYVRLREAKVLGFRSPLKVINALGAWQSALLYFWIFRVRFARRLQRSR